MSNTGGARRNQHQASSVHTAMMNQEHEKLSTMGDDYTDNNSMQNLQRDPSAKSVFAVAYSQKSDKQGPPSNYNQAQY